jgi:uncharacterized protein (TIGR02145 family)
MKQIIASVLVALPILLNAQQACEPTADLNQDGVVGISDLLNLLSAYGDTDLDFDGIYDSVDDCVGAFDECGVCNGPGSIYDCGCTAIPDGDCDCEGNQFDAIGDCGGDCIDDFDGDGICDNPPDGCLGENWITYHDYDYEIVEINGQCWFAENLKTSTYANGDIIPNWSGSGSDWWEAAGEHHGGTATGMMKEPYIMNTLGEYPCIAEILGFHYNGNAVQDSRGLCPVGWHVPSMDDFESLFAFAEESASLRSTNESDLEDPWYSCNYGAYDFWDGTDLYGFNALESWYTEEGGFTTPLLTGMWTSEFVTNGNQPYGYYGKITDITVSAEGIGVGMAVRCVMD